MIFLPLLTDVGNYTPGNPRKFRQPGLSKKWNPIFKDPHLNTIYVSLNLNPDIQN